MTEPSNAAIPLVGASCPPTVYGPLTPTDFVKYQGASGDFNPIHHDHQFAREAGFPGVFCVGMLQAGLLASCAVDWLGPMNIRRYRVRFQEQCWPGDVITCIATVTKVAPRGAHHLVEVQLVGTRQTGALVADAAAEFEFLTSC
jgi:acyl dehydratase